MQISDGNIERMIQVSTHLPQTCRLVCCVLCIVLRCGCYSFYMQNKVNLLLREPLRAVVCVCTSAVY